MRRRTMSDKPQGDMVLKVPMLIYSRVVGYLTPVSSWHDSKRQEFADRVTFTLPRVGDERADSD